METYLKQLEEACAAAGLDLADVCRAEGVAATTLMRWRAGAYSCREATARSLFKRIEKMKRAKLRRAERAARSVDRVAS